MTAMRILVIEDDKHLAGSVKRGLEPRVSP